MLKKILIFIAALIVLLLVLSAFLPSSYKVNRSTTINAPVEKVFNQVADLNNYLKWNPWVKMDPKAKNTISENNYGVGAVWSWEGEVVGKGNMSFVTVEEYGKIASKLVFESPRANQANDLWTFESEGNTTKVNWSIEGELGYPIGRLMGLMMDDMLGKDFEQGLKNLKDICEN